MRADLLTLTDAALTALANRGLVKRATKDLDAGAGPTITEQDGTVAGRFPDGVTTELRPDGAMTCSCPAAGVCRHQLGVILAYQRKHAVPPFVRWSPGDLTDRLTAHVAPGVLAKAERARQAGFTARLHRPTPDHPEPTAELGSCTVRFLVPHELNHVHTDAARPEAVALAVWAFRAADNQGLLDEDVELEVGRPAPAHSMAAAVDLATTLLLDGAMHAGTSMAGAIVRAEHDIAHLRYPLAVVAELADQLTAYRTRAAHYRPERFAELVAEMHARHRAVVNGGASPASRVLGSDEPAETPLHRARLTGLGCRLTGTAADRTVDVYFADPGGTVLVLRRRWDGTHTGAELSGRRIGAATLAQLAAGNLVSESAARSASRVVRLVSNRVTKTTVTPSTGNWERLTGAVLVRNLAALDRTLVALSPRLIRPRVEAEQVRAVAVAQVLDIGYRPGDQRLDAVIADLEGTKAVVSATYRPTSPAALDAVNAALHAGPRFVAGAVSRTRGTLIIDPTSLVVGNRVVVPDLSPGDGSAALTPAMSAPVDVVTAALNQAFDVCAEAAHRGLRHLPARFGPRVDAAADGLRGAGLPTTAAVLTRFAAALTDPEAAVDTWVDAQIRLTTIADVR